MSAQIQSREEGGATEIPSTERVAAVDGPEVHQQRKEWTLKGMLMMALCCGAPILLILAIPLFGFSLAGVADIINRTSPILHKV